jgi:MoaA/NifB/PqqE/SkfB family radical SAM enzyme
MEDAIVEFANSGIQTGLVTNGTLLDGKVAERAAMFCEWVRISIDASTPDTYHLTHREDKTMFFHVLQNVDALVRDRNMYKTDCVIGASFLIHPANYKEIYSFAELAANMGVDYVQFKPLLTIRKWFSEDDMSKQIIQDMAMAKEDFESENFHVAANFGRFQHVKVGFKRPYDQCLGHNLIAIIMATGQMNVCCHQRPRANYTFGDLHRQGFEEIWFGKEREEAVRNIKFSECPSCKYEMYNQYLWAMHRQPRHANFI